MSDIAKNYGVTIADIIKWNQLSSTTITPGTKLKLYIK
ncbi:MAG: LysM peptidoglycan-binding domain-containing protein [Prevotella sp.]|nr:LysM peptidoglycan-binding domain-containing protein [Prevotella sp.]